MRYICLILMLVFVPKTACAEDYMQEQAEGAGLYEVLDYYDRTVEPYLVESGIDFNPEAMIDNIYEGNLKISPTGMINGAIKLFTGCLKENFSAMLIVMMLSFLSGFMNSISGLGKNEGNSQAAFYICFCVICGICIKAFTQSVENGVEAINLMSDFVKISAPVLVTLTAMSGQAVTAIVFSPVLYSAASVAITASSGILLPLIYSTFSLSALGCVGEGINLDRMVKLLKNISRWIMGFFLTFFSGLSALGATAGGAMNAVAGKTIKYAVGNFVPFVGGMLSDSIDMIVACTAVVKGAAGTGVAAVVILIFAVCGVQLISQMFLFRLAAALTAPVADERIVKLLDDIADCISMVFAALCMCSFLFLVIVTFMINSAML